MIMMKQQIIILLSFFCLSGLWAQCRLDKSAWKLVFSEEFDDPSADLSQNWYYDLGFGLINGPCSDAPACEKACNDPENIELKGGYAYFHSTVVPNTPCDNEVVNYKIAKIRSKYSDFDPSLNICQANNPVDETPSGFLYGMFEIRCKLTKEAGTYPNFWLSGNDSWPPEVDAFEYHGTDHFRFFSSNIWSTNKGEFSCSNFYKFPFDLTNGFHTWTVVWTPTQLSWFFDNIELKTTYFGPGIPGSPEGGHDGISACRWQKMDVILGSSLCCPFINEEGSFDPFIVDYVRVYKPDALLSYDQYSGKDSGVSIRSYQDNHVIPTYNSTMNKSMVDWNLLTYKTEDYYDYEVISDLNIAQDGGKFIYKGRFDLVWETYIWNGTYYSAPISWDQTINGSLAIAQNGEIKYFEYQNKLYYHRYPENIFKTINIGEVPLHNVKDQITPTSNGLEVFYRGTDNYIYHCHRSSVSSDVWTVENISTGISPHSGGELVLDPSNNGVLYHKTVFNQVGRFEKSISGSWDHKVLVKNMIGYIQSSLSIDSGGTKLFFRNSSNQLYLLEKDGGRWMLEGVLVTPASFGGPTAPFKVNNVKGGINIGNNPFRIYFQGTNNKIWEIKESRSLSSGFEINTIDFEEGYHYVKNDLELTIASQQSEDLCFIGLDNKIKRVFYGPCEVEDPPCSTDPTTNVIYRSDVEKKNKQSLVSQGIDKDEVMVHPNPFRSFTTVSIENDENKLNNIFARLPNGRLINAFENINSRKIYLNLSNCPNGLIFIEVETTDGKVVRKIVKH